jgi:hypothetical protein
VLRSSKIRLLVCKEIYPAVGVRQFVGFDDKLTDAASQQAMHKAILPNSSLDA